MDMSITPAQQRRANAVAQAFGTTRATAVVIGNQDRVLSYTQPGYRKNTTGEYVGSTYRNNFGWKNTHYQPAECTVEIKDDSKL